MPWPVLDHSLELGGRGAFHRRRVEIIGPFRHQERIRLPNVDMEAEDEIAAAEDGFVRRVAFRALAPSWVMDLVVRTVLPARPGAPARLGGAALYHRDRNAYRSRTALAAAGELPGAGRWEVAVAWPGSTDPRFARHLYLRDEPPGEYPGPVWVCHQRLLVARPERWWTLESRRICEAPVPLRRLAACAGRVLRRPLLYARERWLPRSPLQVNGFVLLPRGWETHVEQRWRFT